MPEDLRLAGIELGGTKCIVVRGTGNRIIQRKQLPTTTPDETLGRAIRILQEWQEEEALAAVGIASFGPVRVNPASADYGTILETPKRGWSGTQVLAAVQQALACPIGIDTDVNAAALAEHACGNAQGCGTVVYLTVGTGVGGGVLVNGKPVHGRLHPEIGHLRFRRMAGDGFAGCCPFHQDCIEGLISGPALARRIGVNGGLADPAHDGWNAVAHDLAQLLAGLLLALSPDRIVIGGGVANGQPHLLDLARQMVPGMLAGYLGRLDMSAMEDIVRPAALGDDAGPTGALLLAGQAWKAARRQ